MTQMLLDSGEDGGWGVGDRELTVRTARLGSPEGLAP